MDKYAKMAAAAVLLLLLILGAAVMHLNSQVKELTVTEQGLRAQLQAAQDAAKVAQDAAVTAEAKAAAAAVVAAAPPPVILRAPPTPDEALAEVFDDSAVPQATLNTIKTRYENLFVNYYFHSRCGSATQDDYLLLNTLLLEELASAGAGARMQQNILTAARGSYDEVYAKADCKNASPDYRAYLDSVRARRK